MATITLPNTLLNSTVADASEVMADFTAITSGLVNGQNDFNFKSLTVQSTTTFLGPTSYNSSISFAQSATMSGPLYLYSAAYFSGQNESRYYHATSALTGFYVGVRAQTALTASYDIRLPDAPTQSGKFLGYNGTNYVWNGSNTLLNFSSAVASTTASANNAHIDVTTGSSTRIVDLPAAATNSGLMLFIKKVDTGSGFVQIDPNSSELIDGYASVKLHLKNEAVTILCNGTGWDIVGYRSSDEVSSYVPTYTASTGTFSSVTTNNFRYWKSAIDTVSVQVEATGTTSSPTTTVRFTVPISGLEAAKGTGVAPTTGLVNGGTVGLFQWISASVVGVKRNDGTWPAAAGSNFNGMFSFKIDPTA